MLYKKREWMFAIVCVICYNINSACGFKKLIGKYKKFIFNN